METIEDVSSSPYSTVKPPSVITPFLGDRDKKEFLWPKDWKVKMTKQMNIWKTKWEGRKEKEGAKNKRKNGRKLGREGRIAHL